MNCTSNQCKCITNKYFVYSSLTCVDKTKNNTQCTSNNTCRADLGLSCQSGLCQCDSTLQFWNAVQDKCVAFMSNGGIGCTIDSHCQIAKGLICNLTLNSTCGTCSCPWDYFWNATSCCNFLKIFFNVFLNFLFSYKKCLWHKLCSCN